MLITQGHTHEIIAEKLKISIKIVFNIKYRGIKKQGNKCLTIRHAYWKEVVLNTSMGGDGIIFAASRTIKKVAN